MQSKRYTLSHPNAQILAKYEIPLGLSSKLMRLSDFDLLDFTIDDSGSMLANSDVRGRNGRFLTRWEEATQRMRSLIEIIAYVPIQKIRIKFLNDPRRIEHTRQSSAQIETPEMFINHMFRELEKAQGPSGSTPALKAFRESINSQGSKVRILISNMPLEYLFLW
jgi:hypothetical protein